MTVKMKRYILIQWLFLIALLPVLGQEEIDNDEITVVAPYQPTIDDANKINISPRIPDEKLAKPEFNYTSIAKEYKYTSVLEPISAAKIQGESISKLYQNYIKLGAGNYSTPYLEFSANQLRSKKSAFGVNIRHLSSSGKIKDYAYPGSSTSSLDAYGKKFFGKHTFSSGLFIKKKGVHYYGYKPNDFPGQDLSKKDIKQTYTKLGLNAEYRSNYSAGKKINHYIGASYYYLFDKFKTREHELRFNAGLDRKMEFFSFSEEEKLGLEAGFDYYMRSDSLLNHYLGIVKVLPFYTLSFDQYKFKIGVNTNIDADTNSKVHVYPVVRAEIKVVEDYLITYAGITGELKANSFDNLSSENPFIISSIEKRNTNNKISQYGGVKGRITKFLDYNLSFANSTLVNLPLFVNDTVSSLGEGLNNQFTLVYDDVKLTTLLAEFGFHYKDKFNVLILGKYNSYFLDNEDEAWHKPKLEVSLQADYSLQEKIIVKTAFFTRSKMFARDFEVNSQSGDIETIAVELDPVFDLNFGFEYRYSKVLSGFLNLNNVLGQRHEYWYNYPSYRFNFLFGVTYSF